MSEKIRQRRSMGEGPREKVHWRRSTGEVLPKVTKKVGCRKEESDRIPCEEKNNSLIFLD